MTMLNIEVERIKSRMTKSELAEFIGISNRTLSNWINGKTEIPSSALIKMSNRWNCSVDYLLELSNVIALQVS